jgi:hypothetical protein
VGIDKLKFTIIIKVIAALFTVVHIATSAIDSRVVVVFYFLD